MTPLLGPAVCGRINRLTTTLGPAWFAFFGSLVLSAIALYGMEGPNRDGMLYIETAALFADQGFAAARANFDWVFFPICIAFVTKITSLGYEAAGYALNAVLLASVCATLVQITKHQFRDCAWSACLVALSLPAFNNYRDFLIREFGFWLFCLLAILAALHWAKKPSWRGGFAVQSCIGFACLFRVEALVFFSALALWQLSANQDWRQRLQHLGMLLFLPICGGLILVALIATGALDLNNRIAGFSMAVNPVAAVSKFKLVAAKFGSTVLNSYSADEATSILFFGLLSTIARKFLVHNGAFLFPLLYCLCTDSLRRRLANWQPMTWFFAVYVLVLTAFVTFNLFMSARYVCFLNILTVPLIAVGLTGLIDRFPRWRYAFVGIALLTALANVTSFLPKNTQYRQAGSWLAAHAQLAPKIHVGSPRAGYYAGPAYRVIRNRGLSTAEIEQSVKNREFEYYVIELPQRDAEKSDWIRSLSLVEAERFTNKAGDAVVILRPRDER